MNTAEFFLAWAFGLRAIFIVGSLAGGLALVIGVLLWTINTHEMASSEAGIAMGDDFLKKYLAQERSLIDMGRRLTKIGAIVTALCFPFSLVPSPQDLWEFRVAMLKLAVASPQNVATAGGHIETIVKGLECKYLGQNCPEKKEAKAP